MWVCAHERRYPQRPEASIPWFWVAESPDVGLPEEQYSLSLKHGNISPAALRSKLYLKASVLVCVHIAVGVK